MNQYRCETCTRKDPQGYGWCRYANAHVNPPNTTSVIAEFTARCGCASHSSHQSERDKVLDEMIRRIEFRFEDTNQGRGVVGVMREMINKYKEELRQNKTDSVFIFCNTPAHAFRLDLKNKQTKAGE